MRADKTIARQRLGLQALHRGSVSSLSLLRMTERSKFKNSIFIDVQISYEINHFYKEITNVVNKYSGGVCVCRTTSEMNHYKWYF
jgi:hypothetical protein